MPSSSDTVGRETPNGNASWLATTIGRVTLRFSGYPGRSVIGAPWRMQAERYGGYPFRVRGADGVELEAWFSPAAAGTAPENAAPPLPIVMLHGWIEVKELHMRRARQLNELGHDVILFDHRAHGRSTGRWATFGYREREDLAAVIGHARDRGMVGRKVITMGFSMGGATALQHAPTDADVAGVVAFAPFVDLREAVRSFRFKLAPWIGERWLMSGIERAMEEVGFGYEDASTLDAIRCLERPVLLIEGGRDTNLPPRWHTQKLAEAKPGGHVELVTVAEATHCGLCRRTWPGLDRTVHAFCTRVARSVFDERV